MMLTAAEFCEKLIYIAGLKTSYIWGGIGAKITEVNLNEKVKQYPGSNDRHAANARRYLGTGYMFDCVNLAKAVLWGWTREKADRGVVPYAKNGVPDVNADTMITLCKGVSTDFKTILPGEAVWLPGHFGVYVGNGIVVEATPAWTNGVQFTKLGANGYQSRVWSKHGRLPWVEYGKEEDDMAPRFKTINDVPQSLRAETQQLIDSGALKGKGAEGLDVTEDMLRCMIISKRYADQKK